MKAALIVFATLLFSSFAHAGNNDFGSIAGAFAQGFANGMNGQPYIPPPDDNRSFIVTNPNGSQSRYTTYGNPMDGMRIMNERGQMFYVREQ